MFGTGQERLSDWWIDKGAEWGMDPERLFAAYYNQGDFRLWEDIESRLQTTGQPEPIEPKKCVNCQRPQEIGCCEKFEYDRMVGLKLIEGVAVEPELRPDFFGDISEEDRKAWYRKMHPCALCDSAEATWIDAQCLDPKCGCHECDVFVTLVNHCGLVNAWNTTQEKVKANIAGQTPEISENKPEGVDALLPRTWPGVVSYEVTHDVEGPTYHVKGKSKKSHKISLQGYRLKALFEAWGTLYRASSWVLLLSSLRYTRKRMNQNDSVYYGVTRVDVNRALLSTF